MDISKLATKNELKKEIKGVKVEISGLKSETKSIRRELLRVEEKVENIQNEIKEIKVDYKNMDTKLDRLQNTLDGFVGGVDELRVENTVGTHQTRELQLTVEDHEKRLKHIESSKQAS